MVLKFKQGEKIYMLAIGGATKDGIDCYKLVGEKETPKCSFGLGVGKDAEGKSIYSNINAWRKLADISRSIKKADTVMVWGTYESHEYNGNTYESINAEWVSVAGFDGMGAIIGAAQSQGVNVVDKPIDTGDFVEIAGDDDLPF